MADVDPGRCRSLAPDLPAFSGLAGLVDGVQVDLVVLAHPAARHVEDACHAAAAGVASLIEKPPAPSAIEAEPLLALEPPAWMGFNRRFEPAAEAARASLVTHPPTGVELEMSILPHAWGALDGSERVLLDLGPHLVDLASWLTGREVVRVRVATCEVVLLLDDDCLPRPGWARALVAAAAQDRIVGGAVVPPRDASPWLRASERIAAEAEAGGGFFRTLNLACHRELLLRIPFDPAFPAAAGEDRDWCARASRAGVRLVREPSAVVEHRAELDARAFVRRQLRYGAAVHVLRRRGTHVPVSASVLWRGLAAGLGEDPAVGAAMAAALLLTGVGYIGEAVRRWG